MNLHSTVRLIFRIKHGSLLFSVWHENILPSSSKVTLKLSVALLELFFDCINDSESGPKALISGSEVHEVSVWQVSVTVLFSVTFFGSSKVSRHGFSANTRQHQE